MSGVNDVTIIGNLGKEVELKHLPSGGAVANLVVATSEEWKDKNTGEKKSETEWHNISFFGRTAEIAAEYLKKGSKVYIRGSIKTRTWDNAEGVKQYSTGIKGRELQFLDSKGASDNAPQQAPQAKPKDAFDDSLSSDIPF